MTGRLLFLSIALFMGVAMAFQGSLNSALGEKTGLLQATFMVHATGLAVVSALLGWSLCQGGKMEFDGPWYLYLGGVLGVIIVYGVATSIPEVGVAPATTAIIIGQVTTAFLIDHFGWFELQQIPFTWVKGVGLLFLAIGGWLLLK